MLAGSLFPQTDVEEVYKLPGLIEHYQLHKKAAGDGFDFWQFLDLHYNTASKHAKTPHKGVKLPMYNHLSAGFIFILTPLQWRPDLLSGLVLLLPVRFAYENQYSFLQAPFLFQPPRVG